MTCCWKSGGKVNRGYSCFCPDCIATVTDSRYLTYYPLFCSCSFDIMFSCFLQFSLDSLKICCNGNLGFLAHTAVHELDLPSAVEDTEKQYRPILSVC